jgi:eukaryotic-like serine/threonine-protein kinase
LPDESETELHPNASSPSASAIDGGRFVSGTILDARYRIVALLGRGGMGEVYRAEDLKLGEQVALKFLPESLGADGAALARFHREVRTARGISHPNVVRVYDIGEQDGVPFLSMEYVDGEDLSILLKRIGHLPDRKATEVARQLCAGLAAAHQAGVLHRDLKPANVMIDGQGRAKISDFGLAGLAAELRDPDVSGTPSYMAPEQLAQGRTSFASDTYSLGLILYEMFTGERPFRAASREELINEHRDSEPSSPISHVETLDPLVERVILRCLAREPEERPSSPLEVAASLPGGDPLAVALAAGETPSPEMVERAVVAGTLSRPRAWGLLATALAGILALLVFYNRQTTLHYDGVPLKPEVLEHGAETLLARIGWPEGSRGLGMHMEARSAFTLAKERHTPDEWRALASDRSTFFDYLYRVGPEGMSPGRRWARVFSADDPAPNLPGMASVLLDSRGRLRQLLAVPESAAVSAASEAAPDWAPLFAAAELDPAEWTPIEPSRAPPVYATSLSAWTGSPADQPQQKFLIEGAARGERVVFWRLSEVEGAQKPAVSAANVIVALVVFAAILVVAAWQALANLRSGRGDRRGSLRIAVVVGVASLGNQFTAVATLTRGAELSVAFAVLAEATFVGGAVWLIYMAIEPLMRRYFPQGLISWSRVLAGRFTDPLVGRDVLLGLAMTAIFSTFFWAPNLWALRSAAGGTLEGGYPHGLNPLLGPILVIGNLFSIIQILLPLGFMFLYVAPRLVLRNSRLAVAVGVVALFGFSLAFEGLNSTGVALGLFVVLICARVGFVGLVALTIFMNNLVLAPASLDGSAWWAPNSWIAIGVVVALAIWAFRTAAEPRDTGG